ncbi:MAG: tetratricopeptide repeat protein [Cohaesibacter sp.]|nr:tetratricopeptide repeat protein [Cohaesibacter sp.]
MSESDFIREVDEELRDEQMKKAWDKYGPFVIGFALLIVLATAANKGWDYWKSSQAATSGDAFLAALQLSENGQTGEAIARLEALKKDGTGGYPTLAEMRIASEIAKEGKVDEALAQFEAIAADSSKGQLMQDLARIRAAGLLLDQGKADEVILQLTSMMDGNDFRHSARELVLLAYLDKADFAKALPIAERVVQDAESPAQLRQRAEVYAAYIRSQIGEEASKAKEAS